MTMNKIISANPYHNAFYAEKESDLKYKKNREKYSLSIRFVNDDCDIVVARSYNTDVAVIDNKEKIMIISKSRYSMTTGKQLDRLRGACPVDYKVIEYDYERFCWVNSREQIHNIIKKAGDEAREYLQKTEYKSKLWRDYSIALHNYYNSYGNTALYKRKLEERNEYEAELKRKRKLRPIVRRPESEIQQEKTREVREVNNRRCVANYSKVKG